MFVDAFVVQLPNDSSDVVVLGMLDFAFVSCYVWQISTWIHTSDRRLHVEPLLQVQRLFLVHYECKCDFNALWRAVFISIANVFIQDELLNFLIFWFACFRFTTHYPNHLSRECLTTSIILPRSRVRRSLRHDTLHVRMSFGLMRVKNDSMNQENWGEESFSSHIVWPLLLFHFRI